MHKVTATRPRKGNAAAPILPFEIAEHLEQIELEEHCRMSSGGGGCGRDSSSPVSDTTERPGDSSFPPSPPRNTSSSSCNLVGGSGSEPRPFEKVALLKRAKRAAKNEAAAKAQVQREKARNLELKASNAVLSSKLEEKDAENAALTARLEEKEAENAALINRLEEKKARNSSPAVKATLARTRRQRGRETNEKLKKENSACVRCFVLFDKNQ